MVCSCPYFQGTYGVLPLSTPQAPQRCRFFQITSHLWWLLCLLTCLLDSGIFRAVQPQEFSVVDIKHGTCQFGFPIPRFTFCSKLIDSVRIMACGLTVTSWGKELDSVCDCFHLHCGAGGWDCIGCIVFVDGGCNMLGIEASLWLVFLPEPSVYTVT